MREVIIKIKISLNQRKESKISKKRMNLKKSPREEWELCFRKRMHSISFIELIIGTLISKRKRKMLSAVNLNFKKLYYNLRGLIPNQPQAKAWLL